MLSTFRKGRNLNLHFLLDETIESKRIKLKQLQQLLPLLSLSNLLDGRQHLCELLLVYKTVLPAPAAATLYTNIKCVVGQHVSVPACPLRREITTAADNPLSLSLSLQSHPSFIIVAAAAGGGAMVKCEFYLRGCDFSERNRLDR